MKKHIIITLALFLGLNFSAGQRLAAQSFYSYQTITKHTIHFVIAWQNKVVLGAGYGYRTADVKFSELSFEYRAPIDEFFTGDNFEVTAGVHNRFIPRKQVIAGGAHLKYKHSETDEKQANALGLAITFLGGFQYLTSTGDAPSSVIGARGTYTPTIFAKVKNSSTGTSATHVFASHQLEAGLHWDMLIKRAIGLSAQPMVANTWTKTDDLVFPDTPSWDVQGHFYFGPTFWVRRE